MVALNCLDKAELGVDTNIKWTTEGGKNIEKNIISWRLDNGTIKLYSKVQ